MRDRFWIIVGLALFVGAITAPFWRVSLEAKNVTSTPNLVLPASQKQCVAPVSYMRDSHMQLLMNWRQEVVRGDHWKYVAFNGKAYQMSLNKTCLSCHKKEQFCDRCHAYAGIPAPSCWHCHFQSKAQFASSSSQQQDDGPQWMRASIMHTVSQKGNRNPSLIPRSEP